MDIAITSTTRTETDETSTPITTFHMASVFTPPASCSNSWTYEPEAANRVAGGLLIQNAAPNDNADPACFPRDFNQYGRKTASAIYSPGFCPAGYTSADLAVDQPTTTAVCCLSNFTYFTTVMENGNAVYAGCTRMLPSTTSTIVTIRQSAEHSTQVTGPITMWAQPITVELQSSDLSLFVTQSATTASQTSASLATNPVSTSLAETTTTGDPHPHTISTEAGIGIGVGVGVGGLGILGAVGFWFFQRRRKRKVSALNDPYQGVYCREIRPTAQGGPYPHPLELDGAEDSTIKNVHELHG